METFVIEGWLSETPFEDILDTWLKVGDEHLAELFTNQFAGKFVSVRYWICNEPVDLDTAKQRFLESYYGAVEADYEFRYSEITGNLWADENLQIGGHDLLYELRTYLGKYLILEVDVHES